MQKILFGIAGLLLFLGLSYFYFPRIIFKINALAKKFLFDDSLVKLYRKRMGALYFLGAVIFAYLGILFAPYQPESLSRRNKLYRVYREYHLHQYDKALAGCERLLQKYPRDLYVLEQMAEIYLAKGKKKIARSICERIIKIDPENKKAKKIIKKLEHPNGRTPTTGIRDRQ